MGKSSRLSKSISKSELLDRDVSKSPVKRHLVVHTVANHPQTSITTRVEMHIGRFAQRSCSVPILEIAGDKNVKKSASMVIDTTERSSPISS